MTQQRYRYSARIRTEGGSFLPPMGLAVDWEPALQCAWFAGLRRREIDTTDGTRSSAIQPVWRPDIGEPYVRGFRVTIVSESSRGVTEEFSTAYFRRAAAGLVQDLVRRGRLPECESARCLFSASFDETHAKAGPASPFTVRERPPEMTLAETRFSGVAGAASGETRVAPDADFPVAIPRRVLDEARGIACAARPNESGGILVGRLHRDVESGDVFAEVTAQIPAEHTTSAPDRLTFTPETWAAARAALDRRRRGEVFLGWYHFHPGAEQCASCPEEKRARCSAAGGFMSVDDYQLHRIVFPRAYTIALVFSANGDGGVAHALFGWRRGRLESREFHVIGSAGGLASRRPPSRPTRPAEEG